MLINLKKMSLRRLQNLIDERGPEVYGEIIQALAHDPREGAQRLVRLCQTRQDEARRERQRLVRLFGYERQVWAMGYRVVAGLAEVGRGPLAGPVVAAAVVLPSDANLPGLDEPKRLSAKRRRELYEAVRSIALGVGIGLVQPEGIDDASLSAATCAAMAKAVAGLGVQPDYLLVDGIHLSDVPHPQSAIAGSDGLSGSIAAASVVAKVVRDDHMLEMDKLYPQYGFAHHKGYGTAEHREALARFGPCPIHRRQSLAGQESGVAAAAFARNEQPI